jgi:murein tripeptide amidase MpaA
MKRFLLTCIGLLVTSLGGAQTLERYTEASGQYALGYPVPIPVPSLTPLDGFRDIESLLARHQQLAAEHDFITAQRVGTSTQGRAIWAYRFGRGEPGSNGRGAAIVNGAIHAREWQSPEVVTGLMEALAERGADGDEIVNWLLSHLDIWIIPVLNVDGFTQTQRYPTEVLVGQDPRVSGWPRDGRMRRKNMRNVDADLQTFGDHLFGVDLNRNTPPNWSSGEPFGGSSNNPRSLTYHGTSAASEPEIQALQAVAELAGTEDIRFYVDTHSYTQLFYLPLTENQARNNMARALNQGMRDVLAANGVPYGQSISSATETIGSTDEMFAWLYDAPAYTLELEPGSSGGRQYGGFGVTHDGFILPESEIARVRDQHVYAFLWGFYRQAGPPWLGELSLWDAIGERVYHGEWLANGEQRSLQVSEEGLVAGRDYRMQLRFSKPMQSGPSDIEFSTSMGMAAPALSWVNDDTQQPFTLRDATWVNGQAGLDTYQGEFSLPSGDNRLRVEMRDLADLQLDADPAQPVAWSRGSWTAYLDDSGVAGVVGGGDEQHRLASANLAEQGVAAGIWWDPTRDGEGVELLLANNGEQRLLALLWYHYDEDGKPRWWLSDTVPLAEQMTLTLRQYDASGERVDVAAAELSFVSGRSARLSVLQAGSDALLERQIRPFDFAGQAPDPALTGSWYNPDDAGWGLTITDRGEQRVSVVYYYDANGAPRWALATGGRSEQRLAPRHFTGACLECPAQPPERWSTPGELALLTTSPLQINLSLSYPDGGDWQRSNVALERLTGGE